MNPESWQRVRELLDRAPAVKGSGRSVLPRMRARFEGRLGAVGGPV